jgi:cysteinyl-tRNA synthetase
VDEAERRVEYLYTTLEALRVAGAGDIEGAKDDPQLKAQAKVIGEAAEGVLSALDRDLNTQQALAVLGELGKAANEVAVFTSKAKKDPGKAASGRKLARDAEHALLEAVKPLGLLLAPSATFFARTRVQRIKNRGLDAANIDAKVDERNAARSAKDFARSDAIRKELSLLGVEILDTPEGSSWKVGV